MSDDFQQALSVEQFCHRYGVSRAHLYRLFEAGELTPRKTGRRTLIPIAEANRWLEALPKGTGQ